MRRAWKSSLSFRVFFEMKKILAMLPLALASGVAMAEGESAVTTVSDYTGIFTAFQQDLTGLVSAAKPVLIAVVGGGLIIWGALSLIGVLKRAFTVGKGR